MRLFRRSLLAEADRCLTDGVRLPVLGLRDRRPREMLQAMRAAEEATRHGRRLELRIALDYSARDTILRAAKAVRAEAGADSLTRDEFAELLSMVNHGGRRAPNVDLLVRTGGEQRL